MSLYLYQEDGVRFLSHRNTACLADDMGLGKSVQAIAAADEIGAQTVVVLCPASARVNWIREFAKWQTKARAAGIIRTGTDNAVPLGVTICSYDLAHRQAVAAKLAALDIDLLILDEGHYLKSRRARRTKAVYGKDGLASRAKTVWVLTGTPAPNNPAELWPMLNALMPMAITNGSGRPMDYWRFVNGFCSTVDNGFGIKITGGKNIGNLKHRIAPYFLRRKKADVLPDLPPIRFADLVLEPGPLALQLAEAELGPEGDAIRAAVAEADSDGLVSVQSSVAALRRLTGLAKVRPVIDQVVDDLEGGLGKIVIFAWHRDVICQISEGLTKYRPCVLHGGTSFVERQLAIDGFQQHADRRVFVGQVTAAGTAITLTAASDVLFAETSWVPADNAQAAARCHRIGQRSGVLVRFAQLNGSLDEQVTKALRRKTAVLTELFG